MIVDGNDLVYQSTLSLHPQLEWHELHRVSEIPRCCLPEARGLVNRIAKLILQAGNPAAVAGAAATVIFATAFYRYQLNNPASDIAAHIEYAKRIRDLSNVTGPHFLFQVLLNIAFDISGVSYKTVTTWLLALCYGAMAAFIVREIARRAPHISATLRAFATIAVLLASHVFLQSAFIPDFYYGYIVPISYHNPTQQLSKLLALWILFAYGRLVLEEPQGSLLPAILLLGVGCILSAIAKPSFLVAFLPAAGLVALWHLWAGQRRGVTLFLAGIAIPSTLILAAQFYWTYVSGAGAAGEGIIFAPFAAASRDPLTMLLRLPGSLFFPGIVLVLALRLRAVTARLSFAWLLLLIGLAESFLLAESGSRLRSGNFYWTGQTVMFLVYVESMLRLIAQDLRREWIGWAAFALHFIFGTVFYGAVILFAEEQYQGRSVP